MKILYVSLLNFNKVLVTAENTASFNKVNLELKNGDTFLSVEKHTISENTVELILNKDVDIKRDLFLNYEGNSFKTIYKNLFETDAFNEKYYYSGELGALYTKDSTTFKVWSPVATSINVLLYQNGDVDIPTEPRRIKMIEKDGVWTCKVSGDLHASFYTYEVTVYNVTNEAVDPYSKSVGVNGLRGSVIDLSKTNPYGFEEDNHNFSGSYTDAIIYEASVRDLSMHPNSGVKNKGKFIGLTEGSSKSSGGISTVFSHIKELGVTHVQLLPMYDFTYKVVNEKNPTASYNWGYDPENYNSPEGSFATDPYDPVCRVMEMKKMIQFFHKNGISVNMDVVYNHLYHATDNNFEKIFPGYYLRRYDNGDFSNGSGCSNDTASEHLMMRKFIIDSVTYWAKEYHLDGFRFDLMGLHDYTTMNVLREELDSMPKTIMLYGEGWDLNTSLDKKYKAAQYNAKKMPKIGHFNDIMRNTTRGSVFFLDDKGFVSGKQNLESEIKKCITGCVNYSENIKGPFITAEQSINYISAHDNNTTWDKLELSNPKDSVEDRKSMLKLANAIVFTSQGIPFIHAGVEFCRTKNGVENSYKSPDNINWMDWDRKKDFLDVFSYYKGLISIRNEHPAFKMNSIEDIRENIKFLDDMPKNVVAFMLKGNVNGDSWKDILVVYNANKESVDITIPNDSWFMAANKDYAGIDAIKNINGSCVTVEPISMCLLYTV